jgi:hypothetical protein
MLIRSRLLTVCAILPFLFIAADAQSPAPAAGAAAWLDHYREPAARLVGEALAGRFAWERLALLGDTFGNRLSGSQALEDTIQ